MAGQKNKKKDKKPISVTKGNYSDFYNVITNNIVAGATDHDSIRGLLKFEEDFLNNIQAVETERNELLEKCQKK